VYHTRTGGGFESTPLTCEPGGLAGNWDKCSLRFHTFELRALVFETIIRLEDGTGRGAEGQDAWYV
jgi:hypothetical protein